MDDDDGRESFEVNDWDFQQAMNPGGRRRFQNKDSATYGGVRAEIYRIFVWKMEFEKKKFFWSRKKF